MFSAAPVPYIYAARFLLLGTWFARVAGLTTLMMLEPLPIPDKVIELRVFWFLFLLPCLDLDAEPKIPSFFLGLEGILATALFNGGPLVLFYLPLFLKFVLGFCLLPRFICMIYC